MDLVFHYFPMNCGIAFLNHSEHMQNESFINNTTEKSSKREILEISKLFADAPARQAWAYVFEADLISPFASVSRADLSINPPKSTVSLLKNVSLKSFLRYMLPIILNHFALFV